MRDALCVRIWTYSESRIIPRQSRHHYSFVSLSIRKFAIFIRHCIVSYSGVGFEMSRKRKLEEDESDSEQTNPIFSPGKTRVIERVHFSHQLGGESLFEVCSQL